MTALDQLDHPEDELRNPTGLSGLKNVISEGRQPNPGKEEPTGPEMIKGDGESTQIPENDGNVNSMDGAKTPENPEKEEPTGPETAKEIGDNPEAPEDGESISDLFLRKDENGEVDPQKKELISDLADKAEKYFNDNKDSLDEKEYKNAMQFLGVFINVQRKKTTECDKNTQKYSIKYDEVISLLDAEKGILSIVEPKSKDIIRNFINYIKSAN